MQRPPTQTASIASSIEPVKNSRVKLVSTDVSPKKAPRRSKRLSAASLRKNQGYRAAQSPKVSKQGWRGEIGGNMPSEKSDARKQKNGGNLATRKSDAHDMAAQPRKNAKQGSNMGDGAKRSSAKSDAPEKAILLPIGVTYDSKKHNGDDLQQREPSKRSKCIPSSGTCDNMKRKDTSSSTLYSQVLKRGVDDMRANIPPNEFIKSDKVSQDNHTGKKRREDSKSPLKSTVLANAAQGMRVASEGEKHPRDVPTATSSVPETDAPPQTQTKVTHEGKGDHCNSTLPLESRTDEDVGPQLTKSTHAVMKRQDDGKPAMSSKTHEKASQLAIILPDKYKLRCDTALPPVNPSPDSMLGSKLTELTLQSKLNGNAVPFTPSPKRFTPTTVTRSGGAQAFFPSLPRPPFHRHVQPTSPLRNEITRLEHVVPSNRVVAMDCEMVGVGFDKSMVARVSIVNWDGLPLLDHFVKPTQPITDFRTKVSGITPQLLNSPGSIDFDLCRHWVCLLLQDKILVGHALENDLAVLGLTHPWYHIRDTAYYGPYQKPGGRPKKLKVLAEEHLGRRIQISGVAHDSVEDARAAIDLYKRLQADWDDQVRKKLTLALQYPYYARTLT